MASSGLEPAESVAGADDDMPDLVEENPSDDEPGFRYGVSVYAVRRTDAIQRIGLLAPPCTVASAPEANLAKAKTDPKKAIHQTKAEARPVDSSDPWIQLERCSGITRGDNGGDFKPEPEVRKPPTFHFPRDFLPCDSYSGIVDTTSLHRRHNHPGGGAQGRQRRREKKERAAAAN